MKDQLQGLTVNWCLVEDTFVNFSSLQALFQSLIDSLSVSSVKIGKYLVRCEFLGIFGVTMSGIIWFEFFLWKLVKLDEK